MTNKLTINPRYHFNPEQGTIKHQKARWNTGLSSLGSSPLWLTEQSLTARLLEKATLAISTIAYFELKLTHPEQKPNITPITPTQIDTLVPQNPATSEVYRTTAEDQIDPAIVRETVFANVGTVKELVLATIKMASDMTNNVAQNRLQTKVQWTIRFIVGCAIQFLMSPLSILSNPTLFLAFLHTMNTKTHKSQSEINKEKLIQDFVQIAQSIGKDKIETVLNQLSADQLHLFIGIDQKLKDLFKKPGKKGQLASQSDKVEDPIIVLTSSSKNETAKVRLANIEKTAQTRKLRLIGDQLIPIEELSEETFATERPTENDPIKRLILNPDGSISTITES